MTISNSELILKYILKINEIMKTSRSSSDKNLTAIIYFDKILELRPNHYTAYYHKGNCLILLGEEEKGIQEFDKALEIIENKKYDYHEEINVINERKDILISKGLAFFNLKQYEKAIECFDESLDIMSSDYAFGYKGDALMALKRYEEAKECFDKVIENNPFVLLTLEKLKEIDNYE